ncbi:hypothetical protein GLX30_31950 [Streptomyces sp. Tu 2975]|uniref:hypothetical protein n=1 Tax=Streptomyces sp. Tu 2975 TaxID=2676871 RepID=UPI0013582B31|nr:hypothetical protein [Streptomyces sp. Tu 2975]QIP87877.1 hypothetical protein GLX30_31950 [Streptomyces sp. Tu 2975]
MSSTLTTIVRVMRRHGIAPRRRPAPPPSRLGRGPHGVSKVAVVRGLVGALRSRTGARRH